MHQSLVVSRTLTGKKPKALPGGISKEVRGEYKNRKGRQYQKPIPAAKKRLLKQVYVWGFGGQISNILCSAEFYLRCSKTNNWKLDKTRVQKEMFDSLTTIEKHYARILPLIQKYRCDFDFEPAFSFRKMLPKLRQATENFLQKPSDESFKTIRLVIEELLKPMAMLERIAHDKYPIAQEIAITRGRGFNF